MYTSSDFACLRGDPGEMSYGMWGEFWNTTEFLKMNRIASSAGLNPSSATALL
jgi:hypothetical protein